VSTALRHVVVWLAFVGALIVPALARAALVPTCDAHEQLTRIAVDEGGKLPAPPDEACNLPALMAVADDLGDLRVAAMCDARGASVIAPQRVLPIADDRIDAGSSCEDRSAPVIGPGPRHGPAASPSPALADHAVLGAVVPVLPASYTPAPPFSPVAGGPRSGFPPGVEHPPR
jgi:hypothetical protein